jgi:hypothetical protein
MTQNDIHVALAKKQFQLIGQLSLDLLKERERNGKKDDTWEELVKMNYAAQEGYNHLKK